MSLRILWNYWYSCWGNYSYINILIYFKRSMEAMLLAFEFQLVQHICIYTFITTTYAVSTRKISLALSLPHLHLLLQVSWAWILTNITGICFKTNILSLIARLWHSFNSGWTHVLPKPYHISPPLYCLVLEIALKLLFSHC